MNETRWALAMILVAGVARRALSLRATHATTLAAIVEQGRKDR